MENSPKLIFIDKRGKVTKLNQVNAIVENIAFNPKKKESSQL